MKNFGIGLALGLLGAILSFLVSFTNKIMPLVSYKPMPLTDVLMYVGFATMVGGPLTYWIILPIKERRDRRG